MDHLQIYHLQMDHPQKDHLDHPQIDHLDPPGLPLRDIMQDLSSTDPTQEKCPTVDHADYTAPTRQYKLDHMYPGTDQGSIYLL